MWVLGSPMGSPISPTANKRAMSLHVVGKERVELQLRKQAAGGSAGSSRIRDGIGNYADESETDVRRALVVMLGGALGAYARWALGGWITERAGPVFPWGTLVINLTGSFLLGLFVGVRDSDHYVVHPAWTLLFAIGFVGAYTTFSTFTVETMQLVSLRSFLLAAANVIGSVVLGLIAAGLGMVIGRAL
jgi:fluoride exporter